MIVIVSGLPRSGTSLMMQMLRAGGMPLLTDELRPPDADNPHGYWEYEPVKRLQQDTSWIPKAEGKAVKVISALLQYLPPQPTYKIIFMQRPLQEVLASQTVMLERRGKQSDRADDKTLRPVFAQHLDRTERWLATQKNMAVLPVNYHETIAAPAVTAARVTQFLNLPLVVDAMAGAVDARLHRQRGV
jgi:hypothetical protein